MAIITKARKHWVTVTLYVVFSLFFLGACFVSANTYSAIAQAQRDIALESPQFDAEIVQHGHLNISFSVQLHNPSRYTLHISTLSWYTTLVNSSNPDERIIPLGEDYVGPTRYLEVPAKSTVNYTFWAIVSDPVTLSKLFGFANYSNGLGQSYNLETLPYTHEFTVMLYIGEFDHDYDREAYLNNLVTVILAYSSEEAAP
jgi:hypothetical protein